MFVCAARAAAAAAAGYFSRYYRANTFDIFNNAFFFLIVLQRNFTSFPTKKNSLFFFFVFKKRNNLTCHVYFRRQFATIILRKRVEGEKAGAQLAYNFFFCLTQRFPPSSKGKIQLARYTSSREHLPSTTTSSCGCNFFRRRDMKTTHVVVHRTTTTQQ